MSCLPCWCTICYVIALKFVYWYKRCSLFDYLWCKHLVTWSFIKEFERHIELHKYYSGVKYFLKQFWTNEHYITIHLNYWKSISKSFSFYSNLYRPDNESRNYCNDSFSTSTNNKTVKISLIFYSLYTLRITKWPIGKKRRAKNNHVHGRKRICQTYVTWKSIG